jgi:hypothetical protein
MSGAMYPSQLEITMLAAEAVPAKAKLNANAIKLAEDKVLDLAIVFFTRQFLPFSKWTNVHENSCPSKHFQFVFPDALLAL